MPTSAKSKSRRLPITLPDKTSKGRKISLSPKMKQLVDNKKKRSPSKRKAEEAFSQEEESDDSDDSDEEEGSDATDAEDQESDAADPPSTPSPVKSKKKVSTTNNKKASRNKADVMQLKGADTMSGVLDEISRQQAWLSDLQSSPGFVTMDPEDRITVLNTARKQFELLSQQLKFLVDVSVDKKGEPSGSKETKPRTAPATPKKKTTKKSSVDDKQKAKKKKAVKEESDKEDVNWSPSDMKEENLTRLDGVKTYVWTPQGNVARAAGFLFNHYYIGSDLDYITSWEINPGLQWLPNLATANPDHYATMSFALGKKQDSTRVLIFHKSLLKSKPTQDDAMRFYLVGAVTGARLEPVPGMKNQQICMTPGYKIFHRAMAVIGAIIAAHDKKYRPVEHVHTSTYNSGISFSTKMLNNKGGEGSAAGLLQAELPSKGKKPKPKVEAGEFDWADAVLPVDASITLHDGRAGFKLPKYRDLKIISPLEKNQLQEQDVVLVTFTISYYTRNDFKDGPALSFNVQDAILLRRYADRDTSEGDVKLNPSILPVNLSDDILEKMAAINEPVNLREQVMVADAAKRLESNANVADGEDNEEAGSQDDDDDDEEEEDEEGDEQEEGVEETADKE